jgi:hypothetical protein
MLKICVNPALCDVYGEISEKTLKNSDVRAIELKQPALIPSCRYFAEQFHGELHHPQFLAFAKVYESGLKQTGRFRGIENTLKCVLLN